MKNMIQIIFIAGVAFVNLICGAKDIEIYKAKEETDLTANSQSSEKWSKFDTWLNASKLKTTEHFRVEKIQE